MDTAGGLSSQLKQSQQCTIATLAIDSRPAWREDDGFKRSCGRQVQGNCFQHGG